MADDTLPGPPAGRPTELQQLEAALAAGVITPELFATLRAKLAPAAPAAAPVASRPAPAAPSEELPSLLEMFGSTPSPVVPPPSPPPAPASPARPPTNAADDAAARRRIEEHLAKLRQEEQAAKLRQAAPATPPVVVPAPPAPTFYPAPAPEPTPSPTFYPASPPAAAPTQPALPPVASLPEPSPRRPAPAPAPTASNRTWLPLLLVLLLAVVGGLAYYFTSTSHPDEELTSSQPAMPEPVPAAAPKPTKPKRTKATKRAKTKQKAAKTPVAVAEATNPDDLTEAEDPSPASVVAPVPAAKPAEPAAGRPIAAAAEAGDDAATTKVRDAMASYYADLNAPPLHASQHFAPQVERLYIRQNLTPEAIDAELAHSFFPDNQQAVSQIETGTLRVSSPAADGSRTATFTEVMRLYRVSLQKYQRLRTQVRVRFNPAYQIVYMRQEKLLANTFEQ